MYASVGLGLASRLGFRLLDRSASYVDASLWVAVICSKSGENLDIPLRSG